MLTTQPTALLREWNRRTLNLERPRYDYVTNWFYLQ